MRLYLVTSHSHRGGGEASRDASLCQRYYLVRRTIAVVLACLFYLICRMDSSPGADFVQIISGLTLPSLIFILLRIVPDPDLE